MNDLDLLLDDPEIIVSRIRGLPEAERDAAFQRLFKLRPVLDTGGNLYLYNLTSLPANAKLSAGGRLDLDSLTSLPAGVKLNAGRDLDLGNLTSLPAGFDRKTVKGRVYLKGKTV